MTSSPKTIEQTAEDYKQLNRQYWNERASSYAAQHRDELGGTQHVAWARELDSHIQEAWSGRPRTDISVLDIGCGPGFFTIVLAELGYQVTAVDYTPSMLAQAKDNAHRWGQQATFVRMDAEHLDFADESFNVVVSRNLTWNLPHPDNAYCEWKRVLTAGGLLLNFDANWYGYLYDDNLRAGYDADRRRTAEEGFPDRYLHTDIVSMEALAQAVRPAWDRLVLEEFGFYVNIDPRVSDRVWSAEELANQASTPLFGIVAHKPKV